MKKKNFYPLAGLLLLAALVLTAIPARADVKASANTGRVTEGLNLHSSKSVTSTNVLQVIPAGKIVSILKRESDNWYRVQYGNVTGYVKSNYLEDNPDVYYTIENARLRSSMDSSSTKNLIGTIRAGNTYEMELLEDMKNGWFYVNYRGWIGYIRSSSLKKKSGSTGTSIDLKNVKFESIFAEYNGKEKALPKVEGLPTGVKVTYDSTESPKNIGVYEVTATFAAEKSGVKLVNASPKTATLTIGVKQGTTYIVNGLKYTIIKEQINGTGTVKVSGSKYQSIKELKVPDRVRIGGTFFKITAIKKQAFKAMKNLQKVELGNNITTIGSNAFRDCPKLAFVILGKKVEKVGYAAFHGNKALTRVTIRSKVMNQVGKSAFGSISTNAVIKVPAAKLSAYTKLLQARGTSKKVTIH